MAEKPMLCLKRRTDDGWARHAVQDVDAVLVDHAHCEMKAASNALSLAVRHPEDAEIVRALTGLAREEIDHFQRVLALLTSRGVRLGPPAVDTYAADLRRRARDSLAEAPGTPLVDRLLVAALIEARSCERFKLLAEATAGRASHADHHALWNDLLASEARHFRTFVDLAQRAAGGDRGSVAARLERLADVEGAVVAAIEARGASRSRATMHG